MAYLYTVYHDNKYNMQLNMILNIKYKLLLLFVIV